AGGTAATARSLANVFLRDGVFPYNPCAPTPYNALSVKNTQPNIAQMKCNDPQLDTDTANGVNWYKSGMVLKPSGNNGQRSFFGSPFPEGGLFVMADGGVHVIPWDFNLDTGEGSTGMANLTQLLVTDDGVAQLPN